jgi:hypothetical protein
MDLSIVSPDPKRERFIFRKTPSQRTEHHHPMTSIRTADRASLALVLLACNGDDYDNNDKTLFVVRRNRMFLVVEGNVALSRFWKIGFECFQSRAARPQLCRPNHRPLW